MAEAKKLNVLLATLQRDCIDSGGMLKFCLKEEVQRMKHELWNLKVKEYNIVAYTQRFNELALMCPRMVEPERVKVDGTEIVSSWITSICETLFLPRHVGQCTIKYHKCGKVGYKVMYCKEKNVATGANALPILTCYDWVSNMPTVTIQERFSKRKLRKFRGQLMSFVNTRFSSLLDIKPIKIEDSYEVELVDGRVVSTNTVLKGCTLSLVNHIFEIDLMPIELGTFDVIIGMDWLVKHDAVIVCGEKVVRIPYGNKTLIVEGDKGGSRLKIISCIKAHVPVIRNFPEVFPEELPGLPPLRQVEFRIYLVPGVAPVARAPYRLAPSEIKELSVQLQELLEKGFIRPSSSPCKVLVCTLRSICDQDITSYALKRKTFRLLHLELVFIDDILVYSKDKEEHGKHLKTILEVLKKERLYAKFSKCDFWLDSVQFLGHVIDHSGVHVDLAKIKAIKSWAAPMTPTEVRQFLRLVRYYWRFIEGFSLISKPLTKLTQKNKKYEWGKEEEAFQTLKQKLCSAPILALPEGTKDVMVYCDASPKGYGAVLMVYFDIKWICVFTHIKAEHQKPFRLLQQPEIPVWKWEIITMDFVSGLPRMPSGRQKSYAARRLKPLEFEVGDIVLLKIVARVGPVAYTLELPEELKGIHSTFHVLNLKKCLAVVEIVDKEVKRLKQSRIPIVKVHWNSQRGPEFTWEREDQIKEKYPYLFTSKDKAMRVNETS
ncbi:putative reverse transcriptase domain-containing protein [Tanacetum coccineum]